MTFHFSSFNSEQLHTGRIVLCDISNVKTCQYYTVDSPKLNLLLCDCQMTQDGSWLDLLSLLISKLVQLRSGWSVLILNKKTAALSCTATTVSYLALFIPNPADSRVNTFCNVPQNYLNACSDVQNFLWFQCCCCSWGGEMEAVFQPLDEQSE